ncbi:MAG: hypothetical protein HY399_08570 [Elusimicrobia bacterium]|nr:hypothetical protein [Elusimicrobiota bacterium]
MKRTLHFILILTLACFFLDRRLPAETFSDENKVLRGLHAISQKAQDLKQNKDALHDFGDGRGAVPAHQHKNGGGWVENTAQVEESVYVGPQAQVYGTAEVIGGTVVQDRAQIYEGAQVIGGIIAGEARVHSFPGDPQRMGHSFLSGHFEINGKAEVSENATVFASLDSHVTVGGNAKVKGRSRLSGFMAVTDNVEICGDALLHKGTQDRPEVIGGDQKFCGGINPSPSPTRIQFRISPDSNPKRKLKT